MFNKGFIEIFKCSFFNILDDERCMKKSLKKFNFYILSIKRMKNRILIYVF